MLKILKSKQGEGYIDMAILVLCAMLVIALAVRVGTETTNRELLLREKTGIRPKVNWSKTGRIQLNEEIQVTVTFETDIGLFGGFGSFPVTLRADAAGKSEVYWK